MANKSDNTWQEDPAEIITIENKSSQNYMLELPSGRYRLDAGRKMKTMRSILDVGQVQGLVDSGNLVVTDPA